MNSLTRQYLLAVIFIGVAIYQCVIKDYLEFALYLAAGVSFALNALALEDKLAAYKKPLAIATWIFIGGTGILFLYIIQFKYL